MKIMVAGDWHSELHEEVVQRALLGLGHEVVAFKWHGYFERRPGWRGRAGHLLQRIQNKYVAGPLIARINRDFIAAVRRARPECIFIYRGTHITAGSLRAVREILPGVVLLAYNNDDPFAPHQPKYLWRHFLAAVPECDLVFAYRHANLEEYRLAGARRVELLRSWFVPERNHPVRLTAADRDRYDCDVVFVGHHEDDGRVACLEAVVRQGHRVRVFGPGYEWDPVLRRSPVLAALVPVRLVWGEDYNRALCGAKLALCFFSKLNRDTYTRRCFEIPATGTAMLSEYSDDLATLFKPGEEVELFRNPAELLEKLTRLLDDDGRRREIAAAGMARVKRDRHDVSSRMAVVAEIAESLAREKRNG